MRVEQQIEYEAQSDAEAIQVARERLGREAVILSSRPVRTGGVMGFFQREVLWVTAGIIVPDRDDVAKESRERMVAFQHLLEVRKAVSGAIPPETPRRDGSAFAAPAAPQVSQAAAARAYEANSGNPRAEGYQARDVDEIKGILGRVLARLEGEGGAPAERAPESAEENGASEAGARPQAQAQAAADDENVRTLRSLDVDEEIALGLAAEHAMSASGVSFREWLPSAVPTMGLDASSAVGGRKILFAGPTGVGKTTTIAKIAASLSLWGDRKAVLMTADTYRIAAVEQLRTYAKILGIPIEVIASPDDVEGAMARHGDADLILMDTAGRSHYDDGRISELQALYDAYRPDSVHLVMAANIKYRDMLNVIERMGVVPISALIFTKLDETSAYGTMLNAMRDFGLPASFFTSGQNVPNDIEVARGDRFVELLYGGADGKASA